MNEFPYGKQAATVEQIFNQYIHPKISNVSVDITRTSNSEDLVEENEENISFKQKSKNTVDELMKDIRIVGINKIDPIKYQVVDI